ncbi:uncharacterized protein LOC127279020 [Leptopilina boulardi]|uniref:uncharacterized protein LOC127279020 n=1 Tax=Leptopilina boulardi TaxID=63433 RepID=UPI0021F5254C|nr:uncharacterized protein LOC127279020 [Leptopilina boulardi]
MVERWHRTLKAAIMCHAGENWTRALSSVLLGLRTSVLKCGYSPAEYTFGTTLRIPGEFTLPRENDQDRNTFVTEFKNYINRIKPIPVTHNHNRRVFIHKELENSTHVFLKAPPIRKSLERPYSGPHRVTQRISDRVYEIEVNGNKKRVSIENIKPAFFLPEEQITTTNTSENAHSSHVDNKQNVIEQNKKTENYVQNDKETENLISDKDSNKNDIVIHRKNTKNNPEIIIPVAIDLEHELERHETRKHVRFVPSILRRNKREEKPIVETNNKKIIVSDAIPNRSDKDIQKRQKFVPSILRRGLKTK